MNHRPFVEKCNLLSDYKPIFCIVLLLLFNCSNDFLKAQHPLNSLDTNTNTNTIATNPVLLSATWPAHWIQMSAKQADPRSYGVYHFRKVAKMATLPASFIIHVSADNRYRLYINGKWIGEGPARGDLTHWQFGSFDLAPYLKVGKNVLAAEVWNLATYAPVAQISNETAFLVQGDDLNQKDFNTSPSWKVICDSAYQPTALNTGNELHSYFVTGPGDRVEGKDYAWGWEQVNYDDSRWPAAAIIATPVAPVGYGTDNKWTLVPRSIPQMEHKIEAPGIIRRVNKGDRVVMNPGGAFAFGANLPRRPLEIGAHQKLRILIDQGYETIGYPELKLTGGYGASVKVTYTEALLDSNGQKGNRDSIKGKTVKGLYDVYLPDGGKDRVYRPLWLRTFRYVELNIETQDQPLEILSFYNVFAAYPFRRSAVFHSNDSSLTKIWEVGWRTARLCAGETYFDCPYYEQLQYEADTRIQALITLYNTSDDRLVRKAINDFYLSLTPEGLTQGRYPSNRFQVIPSFSLWWISMVHDYWMLRPDRNFVKGYLSAVSRVLEWFEYRVDAKTGMLGPLNWWNFVDWNPAFKNGVPDGVHTGQSSIITLQFVMALQQASSVFADFGQKELSEHYIALAKKLADATYRSCFDASRNELADNRDKSAYSQHASILGILTDAIPKIDQKPVMEKILRDTTLSQATFYYRFYMTRAMVKTGLGEDYYQSLTPWRDMLKIGLTTFAEKPEPTRSDCHGWSASPAYDFLATICGIAPGAPGFSKVVIAPALGQLKEVKAAMPSPKGIIKVAIKRQGVNGVQAQIELPDHLSGDFIWNGKSYRLNGGIQQIDVK